MKLKTAWTPYIGIAAALLVPAFVAAQQFNEGDLLTAQSLRILTGRVQALEDNNGFSPVRVVSAFSANEIGIRTFRANGDGIFTVRSTGSGFPNSSVDVDIGGFTVGRSRAGASATAPLRTNEVVTLNSTVAFAGSVNIFWFPLSGDSTLTLQ